MKKLILLLLLFSCFLRAQVDLSNGLIANYPFDNSTIDLISAIEADNMGAQPAIGITGQENTAYYFDGNSHIVIDNTFDLPSKTINLWMQTEDLTSNLQTVFSIDHPSLQYGYTIMHTLINNNTGSPLLNLRTGNSNSIHNQTISENIWYMASITVDENYRKYYVNGELVATFDNLGFLTSPGGIEATTIGCTRIIDRFFKGRIDNLKIYDRALNEDEITALLSFDLNTEQKLIEVIPFADLNEDGIFQESEFVIKEQSCIVNPDELLTFSIFSGEILLIPSQNVSTIELTASTLWEPTGNSIINIDIDDFETDTSIYMPMQAVADFTVQTVDLSSSITRCNRETNYWINYSNIGTVITDGWVELIPDELTNFVSADPPADSTADGKLYWQYENLYPTHSNKIHLVYEMPGVDELGQTIGFEAELQTDDDLGGVKEYHYAELICAYDPNDKLNAPSGYGLENYTLFDDTLEYTIRFQNTGNDTAFNVIIEDNLSHHLDLSSFRPISSSHNVETKIDLSTNQATFTFKDIYLPDSFVNEPGSHGFIKYQILGTEGLSENTDIQNTASIFFDQNPPIVTNTVNNRMVSELPTLPIISSSPSELDFGILALDASFEIPLNIVISNSGDLPLSIESLHFSDPSFHSDGLETLMVEGQSSMELPIYFEPTEIGNYQAELILESNAGTLPVALRGMAITATNLESLKQPHFKIYPNPNEGLFAIEAESGVIKAMYIQNSFGQLILKENSNTAFRQVDLSKQCKGIYFIILDTTNGIFAEKVIVK